ncbi:MAG: hypothetical protein ABR549_03210 [Mycobacteriales bacterium]
MGDPSLGVPDTYALRRRVLLTALMTVLVFLPFAAFVAWLNGPGDDNTWDGLIIPGLIAIYFGVTRPMLRPVREAIRLRRRLAYSAYLAEKERDKK